MIFLYFFQYALVMLCGSVWLYSRPKLLRVNPRARLLVGAASTPLILASATLTLAFLWPKPPTVAFIAGPGVLAALVLYGDRKYLKRLLVRAGIQLRSAMRQPIEINALRLSASGLVAVLIYISASNASYPVTGHDALIYFNEAKVFVQNRSTESIPDFQGEPGELMAGHPHTFFYQAYLAQGLMTGDTGVNPPRDGVGRIASQLTLPFMLLAVAALTVAIFPHPGAISLSIITTLSVTQFWYISFSDSRDAFRILPVLLSIATILPLLRNAKATLVEHVLPAIFWSMSLAAHTLNGIFIPLMWLVMLATALAGRLRLDNFVPFSLIALLIGILPLAHYVNSFVTTGSLMGFGMHYTFYEGTPLLDAFQSGNFWSAERISLLNALTHYAEKYGHAITFFTALTATLVVLAGGRLRIKASYVFACAYFLTILLLPLTELFSDSGVNLQRAMLGNFRYALVIYALVGVVTAPVLVFLNKRVRPSSHAAALSVQLALALLVAGTGIHISKAVSLNPGIRHYADTYIDESMLGLDKLVGGLLEENENWLVDRNDIAYYSARPPLFTYSTLGYEFLSAGTEKRVNELLHEHSVRLIALSYHDPDWWPKTKLYQTIKTSEHVKKLEQKGHWKLFEVEYENLGND